MAKQTYTAYVKKYPDLEKAFRKNKGSRFPTAAAFGKYHYETHGRSEGRTAPGGGAPSGNVPGGRGGGGDNRYELKSTTGRISANDSYAATRFRKNYSREGAMMAAQSDSLYQPGASYDWKVTGALEDLPSRRGMFGTRRAEKRIPMMLEGTKGYARVENINEKDQSKWKFIWQPSGGSPQSRFNQMEGPPDVYLGELLKKKEVEQTTNTPSTTVQSGGDGGGGGDDGGGGARVASGVTALEKQYGDAIFKLRRSVAGIPADAPAWVKTHEDYLRWLRIRSGDSGFESTIVTSPTGVGSSSLLSGVKTKSLMAG